MNSPVELPQVLVGYPQGFLGGFRLTFPRLNRLYTKGALILIRDAFQGLQINRRSPDGKWDIDGGICYEVQKTCHTPIVCYFL